VSEDETEGFSEEDFEVPERISVGIALTTDPAFTRTLLEHLCLALADATGIEVVPHGVWHYRHLVDGLDRGELDLVWLPPLLALRAAASGHVQPIALPVRAGESSYWTALFARKDAPFASARDLERARVAWVDPHSAAGYLIIRAQLQYEGVDLARAFGEERFVGSYDAVTREVMARRADVGATFAYLDADGLPRRGGWADAEIKLVARAGPIPNDIVAARRGLPSLLVRMVQSALVDVQNAELRQAARQLLGADGFEVARPQHLDPLRKLLSSLPAESEGAFSMHPPSRRGGESAPPRPSGPSRS
jgi:ABC-type phosphate/phosphonate transport system substrate-binding protein